MTGSEDAGSRDKTMTKSKGDRQWINDALETAAKIVRGNLKNFTMAFPGAATVDKFYQPTANDDWTNGFWTGILWLLYKRTGDRAFKEAADIQVASFHQRIIDRVVVDHHDMGFLYSPSCVAAWQMTKNPQAKEAALMAADQLISRYREKGGFIQAWGPLGIQEKHSLIIDSLLNMPLLFWATRESGNDVYEKIANQHMKTVIAHVVRADHSTFHSFYFDTQTGMPLYGATHQGNRDGSVWARGQAWAIYGSALAYGKTQDNLWKQTFLDTADYFITHLPGDYVPYWDFDFCDGSQEPRDSSAAAVAACGMLEMLPYLDPALADYFRDMAGRILKSLWDNYAVKDSAVSNGLVDHAVYAKSTQHNNCIESGVDECCLWGDYFYLEGLIRMTGEWEPWW